MSSPTSGSDSDLDIPADPATAARQRSTLGWGLWCPQVMPGIDLGRDLTTTVGSNGLRDLGLVVGMRNMVQGLEIALTTGLGDDVFNTGFGFDGVRVLADPTVAPGLARERIRVAVIDTVRRDPRVRRIVDLEVVDGRLAPSDSASSPDPALRRTAVVSCAFEATSGDAISVSIDGVIGHA